MLRLTATKSILDQARRRLSKRIAEARCSMPPVPIRQQRLTVPLVRGLEPRIVLNASPELNLLGELVVSGTAAAETVQLDVEANGDLAFRDQANQIIPIVNLADGSSSASINPTLVTSGEIRFELAGGDDVLQLDLPNGLNVTVVDGGGDDSTQLQYDKPRFNIPTPTSDRIDVDSETIRLGSSGVTSLSGDHVSLSGDVFYGVAGQRSLLEIDGGSFEIDGRFVLAGEVAVVGAGKVDLSQAVLTASTIETDLRFDLQQFAGSDILIGGADASGAELLRDIGVASADSVTLGPNPLVIDGDLIVQQVTAPTEINAVVTADSIVVVTDTDIDVDDGLKTRGDEITLSTSQRLTIQGALDTSGEHAVGSVNLFADDVRLNSTAIRTSGGLVNVQGPVVIQGDVVIDSQSDRAGGTAGRVQFNDQIQADPNTNATLRIAAVGGSAQLERAVGSTMTSDRDLNGLSIDASQIEVNAIGVTGGDVQLNAEVVRLFGNQIRTSSSGNITVGGPLLLPVGSTRIDAAQNVQFSSFVKGQAGLPGQTGTEDFTVTAGGNAFFESSVTILRDLTVEAERIRISGNVDTTFGEIDGDVRLTSGTDGVVVNSDARIDVGEGTITINGGGGPIDLGKSTLVSTNSGDAVTIQNANDVSLGNINVPDISVPDSGDRVGTLTVGVDGNVSGDTTQLDETTVTVKRFKASTVGAINLSNRGNLIDVLEQVETTNGAITIRSDTTLTVQKVVSNNRDSTSMVDADVQLTVTGAGNDLKITSIMALNSADVVLVADDDILGNDGTDGATQVVTDDLRLEARNNEDDGVDAIRLGIDANDLDATVTGANRGDLVINELNQINLASSDAATDSESIQTSNGQIVITAGTGITVVDSVAVADGADSSLDAEIVARGSNGRIDFEVAGYQNGLGTIVLNNGTKLRAEKPTDVQDTTIPSAQSPGIPSAQSPAEVPAPMLKRQDRAIFLKSANVEFGEEVELAGGRLAGDMPQGVARVFSPRPESVPVVLNPVTGFFEPVDTGVDDSGTAFFIPSSVRTNVLEQAVVNDAVGILTFEIGQPGERGLTVDIDWGAPVETGEFEGRPRRFQQINGLSADESIHIGLDGVDPVVEGIQQGERGRLSVEHFYSQANITDSTVSGRLPPTGPLEVRFSVRHHESIFVMAETVRQDGPPESEFGGVVTSTDNPNTPREGPPRLETGVARFSIPSLTIPQAFIPVREVIPEFETPEVVIRTELVVQAPQTSFETVESTVVLSVGRDEYFQIRVLSPDPSGEAIETERLPDDILDGDKIQQLLGVLPDGRYEIEYVLEGGNTRSILSVDVRDGEATITEEDLDEGILRLNPLDDEESSEEDKPDETVDGAREVRRARPMDGPIVQRVEPVEASRDVELAEGRIEPAHSTAAGLAMTTWLVRRRRARGASRWSAASRFASRRSAQREPNVQPKS